MARPTDPDAPTGPAEALYAAMAAEGVDTSDDAAVQAWVEAFNAGPQERREAILTDEVLARGRAVAGAPGAAPLDEHGLPDEDDAARSAAQAPLLHDIRTLVAFLGDGRALDRRGALPARDVAELAVLLGETDGIDGADGSDVEVSDSVRSWVDQLVELATEADYVRAAKRRLKTTPAGRAAGRSPLEDLEHLFDVMDELGIVSQAVGASGGAWDELGPFFDDLLVPVGVRLLGATEPVAFDELVGLGLERFAADFEFEGDGPSDEDRREMLEDVTGVLIERLQGAGLIAWQGDAAEVEAGEPAGAVTATAAGRWVLHHHLTERLGVPLGTVEPPQHTEDDFPALVAAVPVEGPEDVPRLMNEIAAWVEHRGAQAAIELIDVARSTEDRQLRAVAASAAGLQIGRDAEPYVRTLLDDASTRGVALVWLVDFADEPPESLLDPDLAVFADVLSLTLDQRDPEDVVEIFRRVGPAEAQTAMLQQLWRQTHPGLQDVLGAIGRHHPLPAVAKAARKAAMQHGSHVANQRH